MRTLFLVPPITTTLNRDFAYRHIAPSLGIAYMIGNIQSEFPEIGLVDGYAERLSLHETVKRILDFSPGLVAANVLTTQAHDAAAAATALKQAAPNIKFAVGGPHPSKIPEETLREFPCFDFAAVGEGEETIADLLRALRDAKPTRDIPGLFTRGEDGISTGGPRPFIQNLDSLRFPEWKHTIWPRYRALFSLKLGAPREIFVSTNRGCPFNCIFCAKYMGTSVRERAIQGVADEIERDIADFAAQQIFFSDETFTIHRARTVHLCETLISRGFHNKIRWLCITRPDMIDDELVALFKKSGCFAVCMGGDSMDDSTLGFMKKNVRASDLHNAVRIIKKHGLISEASYILGMPADTADSINLTIRAAVNVNTDFATFSILVPYPGTKIMEIAEKGTEGLVLLTKDWRLYGKQLGNALETSNLNRRALEKLQRKAYWRYYLRPGRIKNAFRMADMRILFFYIATYIFRRFGLPQNRRREK